VRARIVGIILVGSAILFAGSVPAVAQNATQTDVSVGYQFTRLLGADAYDGTNVPKGWTASVTTHVKPALNVVGEINGAYRDGAKQHNILGGVRVGGGRGGNTREAVVFGQFLAGVRHSTDRNDLLLQPGAGLDIRGTSRVSTRFNFDYLIGRSDGVTDKGFRFAAGLVFDLAH